jgi:hypothetical protein
MAYVVNFVDENGTEKNRIIPAVDKTVLNQYFEGGGRYEGAQINRIWTMEEFFTDMKNLAESACCPQKLDSVGFENSTNPRFR